MSLTDWLWIGGTVLASLLVGVVVAICAGKVRAKPTPSTAMEALEHAFDLAYTLYGATPWVQIIVSRSSDGLYIATAYNQLRTMSVSGQRFGSTAAEALGYLSENLRHRAYGRPLQGSMRPPPSKEKS